MLTQDEFNALISVIQRAAISPLEAMGLNTILAKIAPQPEPAEPAPTAEPPATP